jgi:hypothetical protein
MKKLETVFSLLCSTVFFTASLQAQNVNLKVDWDTVYVDKYELADHPNHIFMRVPYGGYKIYNPGEYWKVRDVFVTRVVLVTAMYPETEEFKWVNEKRVAALHRLAPELFDDPQIEFTIILQEDFDNAGEVYNLWHGFALEFRAGVASGGWDSKSLEKIVTGEVAPADSSLLRVLDRNKDLWHNSLIVSDLTGSMTPYIGQLLLWLRLNETAGTFDHLVFFNDGDDKLSEDKVIGHTGGIYSMPNVGWQPMLELAKATILGGCGGECEENDVEALLAGLSACPSCQDIILVADNFSPVRDLELWKSLGRPIRIVLCGSLFSEGRCSINEEYLNLAFWTGGSVHFIEEDIDMLLSLTEGEEIDFQGRLYVVKKGALVPVSRG